MWRAPRGWRVRRVRSDVLGVYAIILIPFTPSIADLQKAKIDQPSVMMSADGKRLATFKPMNREWVPLKKIAPHVITALIATEDHRFYQHYGIDLLRTVDGLLRVFIGDPEGGSTLTQQLARNLYPEEIGRQRTLTRKIKETITAIKIEYAYTKNEILETYLNTMPFLYNAFGIEMAARTYFDKSAQKLNVLESATLIAMLKGTSYYNPVLNPERALRRRNVVLAQMVKRGVLSQADFDQLKSRPIRLDFERQPEAVGPAPHLAATRSQMADRFSGSLRSEHLFRRIDRPHHHRLPFTGARQPGRAPSDGSPAGRRRRGVGDERRPVALDQRERLPRSAAQAVQPFGYFWKAKPTLLDLFIRESPAYRAAVEGGATPEAALAKLKSSKEFMAKLRADKTRLQAGFVAIDPATGQVKAWVGSRDFKTDQFDHVAQARRQPGSTFKPFVYGAALEQGMPPDKRFVDRAVEIPLPDGSVWRPSDLAPPSGRPMTAREGLIYSKNTITAQVMQEIGPRKTAELARRMGVNQSKLDEVPSLALGTSPVTPLEMVAAYSTLAAGGAYRQPSFITRVTDKRGNVLAEFKTESKLVLSDKTAGNLINMMRDAVDLGTGQAIRARFGVRADVAGKTGTTQKNTDGWFISDAPATRCRGRGSASTTRESPCAATTGARAGTTPCCWWAIFFSKRWTARFIDGGARFPVCKTARRHRGAVSRHRQRMVRPGFGLVVWKQRQIDLASAEPRTRARSAARSIRRSARTTETGKAD